MLGLTQVIIYGPSGSSGSFTKKLLIGSLCCTLSLLSISGIWFIYFLTKNFKMNSTKKWMIEIGCVFMIVCLLFDLVMLTGSLQLLRMKSCYRNDWHWPLILIFFEIFCKYVPIWCFTNFFSFRLTQSPKT